MKQEVVVAGVMTGNSLDAFDLAAFSVLIENEVIATFEQVAFVSVSFGNELKALARKLRSLFLKTDGFLLEDNRALAQQFCAQYNSTLHSAYEQLCAALGQSGRETPALLGAHGQTFAHKPPSLTRDNELSYTVQLLDGAALSQRLGVPVVADFRSDDLFSGGEGAPFAPMYQLLLASIMKQAHLCFVNAGNTSNIAVVDVASQHVTGWDCGPCNHFPDLLMRAERATAKDLDGQSASRGKVIPALINKLWSESVVHSGGHNALELSPPRSFDPQWYVLPSDLSSMGVHSFEDRLRTVTAFSAYCIAHSVALASECHERLKSLVLFGGGWKNPVLLAELHALCSGEASYVLEKHRELFDVFKARERPMHIQMSDELSLPSNGMEAGIFAFAALQRVMGKPFSLPAVTGCQAPTVCGAVFTPNAAKMELLGAQLVDEREKFSVLLLSRAAPDNRLSK